MKGKTIWLRPETKESLDALRSKGETFDQAVERLVDIYRQLRGLEPILRGDRAYHEFMDTRKEGLK